MHLTHVLLGTRFSLHVMTCGKDLAVVDWDSFLLALSTLMWAGRSNGERPTALCNGELPGGSRPSGPCHIFKFKLDGNQL